MPKPSVSLEVSGAFAPTLITTQDFVVKKPDWLSFAEAVSAQQEHGPYRVAKWRQAEREDVSRDHDRYRPNAVG